MISSCARGCSIIIRLKASSCFECVRIGQSVGGVRVGHQADFGEFVANLANDIHIPAWLDLDLDALVAGGDFLLDGLQQLRHGVLNADRNPAGDFLEPTAADVFPQRHAVSRASRSQTAASTPPRAM